MAAEPRPLVGLAVAPHPEGRTLLEQEADEVRGIAEGADVDLLDIILLNARSSFTLTGPAHECTALADQFLEIIFTDALQDRVGVWLNPSLGSVLFTAFDNTGTSLESVTGTAGNFVGIDRAANEIRFVSIISLGAGFTIDDLTYGRIGDTSTVPEPGSLALLLAGLLAGAGLRSRRKRD